MSNWIVINEDLVNLDQITRVQWGGSLASPAPLTLIFYSGSSTAVTYTYATKDLALQQLKQVQQVLATPSTISDIRFQQTFQIGISATTSGPIAGGNIILFTGGGFTTNTNFFIDGNQCVVTLFDQDLVMVIVPAGGSTGAKDISATKPNSNGGTTTVTQTAAYTYV